MIRQEQCDKVCRVLDDVLANRPTERDSLIIATRKAFEALEGAKWIPCSDENPKLDGRYLITGKMGTVYSLDFEDGRWYGGIKPVAWMLLPEPYAERREE